MMKAAIIFTLLLTTVLCRPARKNISSSESSEEQVKPARAKQHRALALPQETAVVQKVGVSDDGSVTSEEEAIVNIVSAVKSVITNIFSTSLPDPSVTPDTTSDQSQDDDDDDDDNSEDTEEDESEEDESSEPSTISPVTVSPVTTATESAVGTEEPTADTPEPITPSIVYDQGRGDSLGRYPSNYKTDLYGEDKSYQKIPSPYKSYEYMDGLKKMAYDMPNGNEVEKGLKVYKALQVHADLLEEDTSTPEVESQGLDASSPDQEASPKQALFPNVQEQEVSPSDATATDSSSATNEEEEEEVESTANPSESASASDESEDSEDATATPGAADSQSDESDSVEGDSDEEGAVVADTTTDVPPFFTAK